MVPHGAAVPSVKYDVAWAEVSDQVDALNPVPPPTWAANMLVIPVVEEVVAPEAFASPTRTTSALAADGLVRVAVAFLVQLAVQVVGALWAIGVVVLFPDMTTTCTSVPMLSELLNVAVTVPLAVPVPVAR